GVAGVAQNPAPDTISIIDLAARPPRVAAEIQVPTSVVGPPLSVAITPDGKLALVTANQRVDPNDATKTVPDNRMSVIDLTASPPRVVATLETGAGPAGVSINRAGTLALVAYREAGKVGVFRIRDGKVENVGTVDVGTPASLVSHVAFTPDGRHALVTRNGDHQINVLDVDGERVTRTDRVIGAGRNPYGLVVAPDGHAAVVANIGSGTGDADTVSVIDLSREPWRVVDTVSVGQTPEGIQISPDGRLIAVTVMNGSNKPENSPFRGPGLVKLYRLTGTRLTPAGEARVGTWSQGAAFSRDGRNLLVGNMVERNVQVFAIGENGLRDTGIRIPVNGGSAALRTVEAPAARAGR
ncbi:YncE family protein, partial [Roseomonas sp. NAR14]